MNALKQYPIIVFLRDDVMNNNPIMQLYTTERRQIHY